MFAIFFYKLCNNIFAKAFFLLNIQIKKIAILCTTINIAKLHIEIILKPFIDKCFNPQGIIKLFP